MTEGTEATVTEGTEATVITRRNGATEANGIISTRCDDPLRLRCSVPLCLTVVSVLSVLSGCSRGAAQDDAAPKVPSSIADSSAATVPHGNHDPKYGGVVLMNGDLHFEVVLRRDGRHQVYFSDAMREELPASVASSVDVTVTPPGVAPETVPLHIDESGESWIGRGRPVDNPAQTTARIAYTVQATPYWIDVPFASVVSRTDHGRR
jgi:hypothetical protein